MGCSPHPPAHAYVGLLFLGVKEVKIFRLIALQTQRVIGAGNSLAMFNPGFVGLLVFLLLKHLCNPLHCRVVAVIHQNVYHRFHRGHPAAPSLFNVTHVRSGTSTSNVWVSFGFDLPLPGMEGEKARV